MIAWGYYNWAAETVATKYGLNITGDRSSVGARFLVTLPDHFAPTAFFEKLKRLYSISWSTV
jgi:hypothetical protein